MYPLSKKHLVIYIKENPFAFYHDGSSDTSVKKNKSYVHVYFLCKTIETKFYDMRATTSEDCGKAETCLKQLTLIS